jgi:hypothetical protein
MNFDELEHGKIIYSKTASCVYRIVGKIVGQLGERTVEATLFAGEAKEEATISEGDSQWELLDYIQEDVSENPIAFASLVATTLRIGGVEQQLGQVFGILEKAGLIQIQKQDNGLILPRGN